MAEDTYFRAFTVSRVDRWFDFALDDLGTLAPLPATAFLATAVAVVAEFRAVAPLFAGVGACGVDITAPERVTTTTRMSEAFELPLGSASNFACAGVTDMINCPAR